MRFFARPCFLVHLFTLSGLGLAFGGLVQAAEGKFHWATRLLLCVLVIDHLDGSRRPAGPNRACPESRCGYVRSRGAAFARLI